MKVPTAALITLFLVASCSLSEAHLDGVPTSCCFSYQQRPVPRALIASIYTTSSSCLHPARGDPGHQKKKELCADPQAPWVKAHLKHFQPRNN
ncbi:C-C motif chemokine 3-like [Tyto alba]|uniref:C-C motif chemokine 3-like n=1 Tax=Tyto alba TaxID=56313 RepID=UPI001C66E05F|nr:C-C motif chemokine 3-like [Tyto alba]